LGSGRIFRKNKEGGWGSQIDAHAVDEDKMFNHMKTKTLGVMGLLLAATAPAVASNLSLSWDDDSTAATVTTTGGTTLTGLSGLSFSGITIGLTDYSFGAGDTVSVTYNSTLKTLTFATVGSSWASSIFHGVSGGTTLETITFGSALTGSTSGGTTYTLATLPSVTSITNIDTTFFNDIGAASLLTTGVAGGFIATGSSPNFNHISSDSFGQQATATPEPMSFLLLGSGLMAVGCYRRKLFRS
jgi:hypothetical protein